MFIDRKFPLAHVVGNYNLMNYATCFLNSEEFKIYFSLLRLKYKKKTKAGILNFICYIKFWFSMEQFHDE